MPNDIFDGKQSQWRYASRTQKLKLNSVKYISLTASYRYEQQQLNKVHMKFFLMVIFILYVINKSGPVKIDTVWRRRVFYRRRTSHHELAHIQNFTPSFQCSNELNRRSHCLAYVLPFPMVVSYIAFDISRSRTKNRKTVANRKADSTFLIFVRPALWAKYYVLSRIRTDEWQQMQQTIFERAYY